MVGHPGQGRWVRRTKCQTGPNHHMHMLADVEDDDEYACGHYFEAMVRCGIALSHHPLEHRQLPLHTRHTRSAGAFFSQRDVPQLARAGMFPSGSGSC
jgi:hypothetical protein